MSTDVNDDYKSMLEVADKYSEDASFVDNLVTEFSATSEEITDQSIILKESSDKLKDAISVFKI